MIFQTPAEKISAGVEGGPSGVSRVQRHGSEDPHWLAEFFSLSFKRCFVMEFYELIGKRLN